MCNSITEYSETKNFNYLYLDGNGELGIDRNDSLLGMITRIVLSLFGVRDYNLQHIFPVAQKALSEREVHSLTVKLIKTLGMSLDDFENIQRLSAYYFNPKHTYSSQELHKLKNFIENAKGNLKINNACNLLLQMDTTLDRVHKRALKAIRTFSFETTKVEKLTDAFQKIEDLQTKLQKDGTLRKPMKEKLSLLEMRELESVIQMAPVFRDLKKIGLTFKCQSEIGNIRRNINIANNTVHRLKKLISKETSPQSMHFIFYDCPNFSPIRSPLMKVLAPLVFRLGFKSHLFHAALSYQDSKKQEMEAHVMQQFIHEKRSLFSQAFKTFAPNFDKFFQQYPQEVQVNLQTFYGNQWKRILEQKFAGIVRNFFENGEDYQGFQNPLSRRFLGGVGLQSLFCKGNFYKRMQFSKYQHSLCTEFVIKSIMQCYANLEEEIKKDWDKAATRRHIDTLPPKLPKILSEEAAYSALVPSQMAQSLIANNLVREIKRPLVLGEVMKYHQYDIHEGLNLSRFG